MRFGPPESRSCYIMEGILAVDVEDYIDARDLAASGLADQVVNHLSDHAATESMGVVPYALAEAAEEVAVLLNSRRFVRDVLVLA